MPSRHAANFPLVSTAFSDVFTPTDATGDMRVSQRTNIIDIKPWNTITSYRDTTTGTVTSNTATGEISMTTAATVNSSATLTSRDYTTVQCGSLLEVSIGVRFPTTLAGTQTARWGLFDGTDGAFYQLSASGLVIGRLRASVATTVARASWNIDKLDGTGISGYTLDLTRGTYFNISYSGGGYGTLLFSVIVNDPTDGTQLVLPVHSIVPSASEGTNMSLPCLPLRVELNNGASTATSVTIQVEERSAHIVQMLRPMTRWTSIVRDVSLSTVTTAFTFVMAVRKLAIGRALRCCLRAVEVVSTNRSHVFQILLNPTITGGTWGTPLYQTAGNTVLEQNSTATGVSGGTVIYGGCLPTSAYFKHTLDSEDDVTLSTNDTWALVIRSQVGGGTVVLTGLTFSEEW